VTTVLAWGAALGLCVGAVLFGQTARFPAGRRRPSRSRRLGLVLSLSGPWLVLMGGIALGALTGAWLAAAAAAATGTLLVAGAGLLLVPR
jgi:hypothetical protein